MMNFQKGEVMEREITADGQLILRRTAKERKSKRA
jgi:hypothetical protein